MDSLLPQLFPVRQLGHDPLVGVQVIAVCGLCGREIEVEPFNSFNAFEDLCDPCVQGLSLNDLTPKEKQSLLQAAEVAVAIMEDK